MDKRCANCFYFLEEKYQKKNKSRGRAYGSCYNEQMRQSLGSMADYIDPLAFCCKSGWEKKKNEC